MPSFQVDDELPFHPKVIAAGNGAMGLWVRAAAYSMGHLTDGHIKKRVARTMGSLGDIRGLVRSGLWIEETDDDGDESYLFHAWAHDASGRKRQQSADEILSRRRQYRESKRGGTARNEKGRFAPKPLVGGQSTDEVGSEFHADDGADMQPSDGDKSTHSPTPTKDTSDEVSTRGNRARPSSLIVTEGEFARWYDAYPLHRDREKAKVAYKAARQKGATTEVLLAGAQRYREDPNREQEFTKYPATWLRAGSWADEPLPAPGAPVSTPQRKSVRDRWADKA